MCHEEKRMIQVYDIDIDVLPQRIDRYVQNGRLVPVEKGPAIQLSLDRLSFIELNDVAAVEDLQYRLDVALQRLKALKAKS